MEVSSYKSLLLFVPNQINLFCLKVNFRQASNCCKSVLEAAKLTMANKRQERAYHFPETRLLWKNSWMVGHMLTSGKTSKMFFFGITGSKIKILLGSFAKCCVFGIYTGMFESEFYLE